MTVVFESIVPTMHGSVVCAPAKDIVISNTGLTNFAIHFSKRESVQAVSHLHALAIMSPRSDRVLARDSATPGMIGYARNDQVYSDGFNIATGANLVVGKAQGHGVMASGHHLVRGNAVMGPRRERVRAGNFTNGVFAEARNDGVSAHLLVPYVASFIIMQTPGYLYAEKAAGGPDLIVTISDEITFSTELVTSLRWLLRDTLLLRAQIGTSATLKAVMSDIIGFHDSLHVLFMAVLHDTMTLTSAINLRINMIALIDTLVLTGAMTTVLDAKQLIASILTLRDALDKRFVYSMEDELDLTDSLTGYLSSMVQLVDEMALTDSLAGTGSFIAVMDDTIELGDTLQTKLSAIALMQDQIDFACRFYTDNGEYIAYAFNTTTSGTSKYTNYRFNSFAEVGGVQYGASDHGFFAIGADSDDGVQIDSHITTGLDKLGSTFQKRLLKAYLHFRSDGDMLVSFVSTESGVRSVETYRATPTMADDFKATNCDTPKGKKSVFWAFKIANENGADFDLDGLYVIPLQCGIRSDG